MTDPKSRVQLALELAGYTPSSCTLEHAEAVRALADKLDSSQQRTISVALANVLLRMVDLAGRHPMADMAAEAIGGPICGASLICDRTPGHDNGCHGLDEQATVHPIAGGQGERRFEPVPPGGPGSLAAIQYWLFVSGAFDAHELRACRIADGKYLVRVTDESAGGIDLAWLEAPSLAQAVDLAAEWCRKDSSSAAPASPPADDPITGYCSEHNKLEPCIYCISIYAGTSPPRPPAEDKPLTAMPEHCSVVWCQRLNGHTGACMSRPPVGERSIDECRRETISQNALTEAQAELTRVKADNERLEAELEEERMLVGGFLKREADNRVNLTEAEQTIAGLKEQHQGNLDSMQRGAIRMQAEIRKRDAVVKAARARQLPYDSHKEGRRRLDLDAALSALDAPGQVEPASCNRCHADGFAQCMCDPPAPAGEAAATSPSAVKPVVESGS